MNERTIQLIDSRGNAVATAQIAENDGLCTGAADLRIMPADLLALFREFEDAVNNQLFSHVDQLENSIAARSLRVRFDDASELSITDVQVFPETGELSFRLAKTVPIAAIAPAIIGHPRNELRPL